ncbi:hypothetical protein [Novosphingobium profundi]|uniref:hypothetical protein n=1 Tax=Novosphingobium profundi TaxID=1774954 RepID=UPI001CFE1E23|nr:hypothetical protein [Novosphingobium profundi]
MEQFAREKPKVPEFKILTISSRRHVLQKKHTHTPTKLLPKIKTPPHRIQTGAAAYSHHLSLSPEVIIKSNHQID